jgi:hypothetical protein
VANEDIIIKEPNRVYHWICQECDNCRLNTDDESFEKQHATKIGECWRCGKKEVIVALCHGVKQ